MPVADYRIASLVRMPPEVMDADRSIS